MTSVYPIQYNVFLIKDVIDRFAVYFVCNVNIIIKITFDRTQNTNVYIFVGVSIVAGQRVIVAGIQQIDAVTTVRVSIVVSQRVVAGTPQRDAVFVRVNTVIFNNIII